MDDADQRVQAVLNAPPPTDAQLTAAKTAMPRSVLNVLDTPPPSDAELRQQGFVGSSGQEVEETGAPPVVTLASEISKTGQTAAPIPGWAQTFEGLQRGWTEGNAGMAQSLEGWKLMAGESLERAQETVNTKELIQAQKHSEDYANTHGWWDAASLAERGGKLAPGLAWTFGAGAAAGGAAFVLGAPVTVPALAGMASMAAITSFGQGVYSSMSQGVERPMASAVGLVQAAIAAAATFVGGGAAKEIPVAVAEQMVSEGAKKAALATVIDVAKHAGVAVGLPTLQGLVNASLEHAAATVSKNGRPTPWTEIWKNTKDTALTATLAAPVLAGAGVGLGKVGAHFAKQTATHEEAAAAISNILDAQTNAILKSQIEEQSRLPFLQGQVEMTEAEAEAAREGVKIAESQADEAVKTAQLQAALAELKARETEVAEFGPSAFSDADRLRLLNGVPAMTKGIQKKIAAIRKRGNKQIADATEALKNAEAAAKKARENLADQQERVDNIPNADLAPEYRRVVIRAGLAARVKPKIGKAVLDKLAETGSYDEAAKIALADEPVVPLKGAAKKKAELRAWKDTCGLNLDALLKFVFQHASPEEQQQLAKDLGIAEASDHAEVKRLIYTRLAQTYLQEAMGVSEPELTELMHEASTTVIEGSWSDGRPIAGPDKLGNLHKLTIDEALSYILWSENTDAQAALYAPDGNSFPRDFEMTLRSKIEETKNGQKFIDALDGFRGFYEEIGHVLKEVHDRHTGEDLPLQANYGGSIRRVGSVDAPMNNIVPTMPGKEYVMSEGSPLKASLSATNERGASHEAIVAGGAFAKAHSHAAGVARYEANIGPARLWSAFINDKNVMQGITEKWGESILELVRHRYQDQVHGVPAAQQAHVEWIDEVMHANRIGVLGANPIYTAQHWFTLGNFFLARHNGDLLGHELIPGFAHFLFNQKEMTNEVLSWPIVQSRYEDVNTIGGIARGEQTPQELSYEQNALKWFRYGDKPALVQGTSAVYYAVLKRTGNAAEAKAAAIEAFENCLASGQAHQWTELTTNQITRPETQFAQPDLRLRQHSLEAKILAKNWPANKNIANQIRTEIIARTAGTLFMAPKLAANLAEYAWSGNPSSVLHTAVRMSSKITFGNMLPGTDLISEAVIAGTTGAPFDPEINTAVGGGIIGAAKAAGDAAHLLTGADQFSVHNILKLVIHSYQGATLLGVKKPRAPLIWLDKLLGSK